MIYKLKALKRINDDLYCFSNNGITQTAGAISGAGAITSVNTTETGTASAITTVDASANDGISNLKVTL